MASPVGERRNGHARGWREIRHFGYVDRPFEEVWSLLAKSPQRVLGDDQGHSSGTAASDLHARLAGLDLSRTVRMHFGGIVCDEERARLALRWEDAEHPRLFPLLEAVLELEPLTVRGRQLTQAGVVGCYRPPLGRLGWAADTAAGGEVAVEAVAHFVDELAARLEALIDPVPPEAEEADGEAQESAPDEPERDLRRIFLAVGPLCSRAGGAVGVRRRLSAIPGVVGVEVDPRNSLAEVRYDPTVCGLERLQAELNGGEEPACIATTT